MEQQVRCKRCGRVLKSPQSIAIGMGSTCAGAITRAGKSINIRIDRSARSANQAVGNGIQKGVVSGDLSSKPASRREAIRRIREERRRLFQERKPFQCGVLSHARTPLIYVPAADGGWEENWSGKVISHERLQAYLKKYQFI